jgi:alanyl-tRNA synthetase
MEFSVNKIRKEFLNYFVKNDHKLVHSSPVLPHNDPTMMFVNSGMVQFKNVFTGLENRDYNRATSCQKSVRAGGKHNDLENVGYTARHHTFFEMLGNFSFGDYFKEDAIKYAWDFLTNVVGLPKDKLYATVYHTDEEAVSIWKKISGFSDSKIIRIKTNDNFWSMGDTGPCGPCSEIFYDHGDKIPGGLPGTPEEDGDRYIEIWNMVFMQFDQISKDLRRELPKKSIDTGMGLERISAIMQGVHDNYDIDYFKELIESSSDLTGADSSGENMFSHRVIADHLRSSSFIIADGVMPSNEGRGYVLRRIMRRAMRHAHQLGSKEPLLHRMLPVLISQMGEAYPELKRAEGFIKDVLKSEEERFKTTLDRGLKLLKDESENLKEGDVFSGSTAFKLYDTYGFPLDLTEDILKKSNIKVDNNSFESCMEEQKNRARESWVGSGDGKTETIWFDIKDKFGSTEFLGYSQDYSEAVVSSIVHNNILSDKASKDEIVTIITNQTPFYGESGGQMGDKGLIQFEGGSAKILDTKKYLGSIIAHICKIEKGSLNIGDSVKLIIDTEYRNSLKRNHSATHILHSALRKIFGNHVTQKGSLVASDKLRFDISHPKAISLEEIRQIENMVNSVILANSEVRTKLMQSEDAIASGAVALFGEKYDDEVRVVSMGIEKSNDTDYSIELCGGTHVNRTGDIGLFRIISESAIAAGVRRIEAITGLSSLENYRQADNTILAISSTLKSTKDEVEERINDLIISRKNLQEELEKYKIEISTPSENEIEKNSIKKDDYKVFIKIFDKADPKILRLVAEKLYKKYDDRIFALFAKNSGKISIVVSSGAISSKNKSASDIVKSIAALLGGSGGGGNANIAQSGGVNLEKLNETDIINLIE